MEEIAWIMMIGIIGSIGIENKSMILTEVIII
jgi:hypothetical protein